LEEHAEEFASLSIQGKNAEREPQIKGNFSPLLSSIHLLSTSKDFVHFAELHPPEATAEKLLSHTPVTEAAGIQESIISDAQLPDQTFDRTSPPADQAFIVTSEMRQLLVSIAPTITSLRSGSLGSVGSPSTPVPPAESLITSTVATGSTSAPPPSPGVGSILENLVIQLIGQFMSNMKIYINLILSGE